MTYLIIPTYNERENIQELLFKILELNIIDHILVVDDNSLDGTAEVVREVARQHPSITLLSRHKRYGRGSAGIEGFRYALDHGATLVAEMDADFSHDPAHLSSMLESMARCDVVLGSRFVQGGKDQRGPTRRCLTFFARLYVRSLLSLPIKDVSSGFRVFRRSALEAIDLNNMVSTGQSIVLEILYKCSLMGLQICEVPIVFRERRQGESKLDIVTLLETLVMVLRLRKMARQGRIF